MLNYLRLAQKDVIVFIEMLVIFFVLQFSGIIKYLFFVLWIGVIWIASRKKFKWKYFIISIPALFCALWGSIVSIYNSAMSIETLKEVGFCVTPALGVAVLLCCKNGMTLLRYINGMFFAIITLFFINGIRNFTITDLMESSYAFIFGIFVFFYYYYKQYCLCGVAIICTILADKRIVWGAVIVGMMEILVLFRCKYNNYNFFKKAEKYVTIIGVGCVIGLYGYVFMIKYNIIGEFMVSHGINPMGRLGVWDWFSSYYTVSPFFGGIGLGNVKKYLILLGNKYFDRLHNDVLMYFIELGFIGSVVYFYLHFYCQKLLIRKKYINYKQVILITTFIIYTFMCYCTDNISIYIHYLFPYYVIMSACIFYPPDKLEQEKRYNEVFNYNNSIQCRKSN